MYKAKRQDRIIFLLLSIVSSAPAPRCPILTLLFGILPSNHMKSLFPGIIVWKRPVCKRGARITCRGSESAAGDAVSSPYFENGKRLFAATFTFKSCSNSFIRICVYLEALAKKLHTLLVMLAPVEATCCTVLVEPCRFVGTPKHPAFVITLTARRGR